MTEEQAIQVAAFNGLSVYRRNYDYLANASSDFYHFPAADDGLEGCYVAVYSDPATSQIAVTKHLLSWLGRWTFVPVSGTSTRWLLVRATGTR